MQNDHIHAVGKAKGGGMISKEVSTMQLPSHTPCWEDQR
jgi:hypothetical protein